MRWRAAAVLLVTLFGLGIGIQLGAKPVATVHEHAAPMLVAAGHTLPSVTAIHPHVRDGSIPAAPELVTTAGLPRSASTLLALGLVVALGILMVCWRALSPTTGRSPPRRALQIHSGRAVLTRLCISRR
ncbi:hypothetical protein EB75_09520 [Mycobacterium sp. ST-F2]|nr:hypothetical protein EB75_09520 [Mycobacterium sp. ST-F2]